VRLPESDWNLIHGTRQFSRRSELARQTDRPSEGVMDDKREVALVEKIKMEERCKNNKPSECLTA
jgi:hypothetical protein